MKQAHETGGGRTRFGSRTRSEAGGPEENVEPCQLVRGGVSVAGGRAGYQPDTDAPARSHLEAMCVSCALAPRPAEETSTRGCAKPVAVRVLYACGAAVGGRGVGRRSSLIRRTMRFGARGYCWLAGPFVQEQPCQTHQSNTSNTHAHTHTHAAARWRLVGCQTRVAHISLTRYTTAHTSLTLTRDSRASTTHDPRRILLAHCMYVYSFSHLVAPAHS